MKQKIEPGAVFDFTTPGEMLEHLNTITRQSAQEAARGVAIWRADQDGAVAGGAVTIPGTGQDVIGVDLGMAVRIDAARAAGLATGDTINAYRSVVADKTFLGHATFAAPVFDFGTKSIVLKGGEQIIFTGAGLTATEVTVNLEGIMVPETDLYKIFVR